MNTKFVYAAEKFAAARRLLMLPFPNGQPVAITHAFHECMLGLQDIDESDLTEEAATWVRDLRNLMNVDDIPNDAADGK